MTEDKIPLVAALGTRHEVEHRGLTMVWRSFGSGAPLILVHGSHGNWLHWILNIETLSRHHTLWIPDLPGFGESQDIDGELDDEERLKKLVEMVCETLKTLIGTQSYDLAGFSFGGLVSARLAQQRAPRRLALLAPAGHGSQRRPAGEMVNWHKVPRQKRQLAFKHNLLSQMLSKEEAADDLAVAIYESQCVATRFRSKALARSSALQTILPKMSMPVLLAWGEHDVTAVPGEIGPILVAACASAALQIIPGAGHWLQYERPGEVSALLQHWFAR